jgi:hypothetical protein
MHQIRVSCPIYQYQVGGSLQVNASSYIVRQADFVLYQSLLEGEFCYVLNSRQVGKSSLRVHTRHRLQQEGFACASIDLSSIGSDNITPQQWYKSIAYDLWRGFNLSKKVNFHQYWQLQADFSPVYALSRFIEEIVLTEITAEKVFIFVDEIDSVLNLDFCTHDFFIWIRSCYDRRAEDPAYRRLNFALFGVATPADLSQASRRTPFNIGKAIEIQGFTLHEALSLAQGLQEKFNQPKGILKNILVWTRGQPFLTQKLCQFAQNSFQLPKDGDEAIWVEKLVKEKIINNWEYQDEPEHLSTIRDRLFASKERIISLLGLYQKIIDNPGSIAFDSSHIQMELLLSGLVTTRQGYLEVYNPIYQTIFDRNWSEQQLAELRIYANSLEKWIGSGREELSYLLRGQALQEAQDWAIERHLNNDDYQFLSASQIVDRQEDQKLVEREKLEVAEARLAETDRHNKLQKLWLTAVSISLAIAGGWSGLNVVASYPTAKPALVTP